MILCNPRISSFKVLSGRHATTAAAAAAVSLTVLWRPSQTSICCRHCRKYGFLVRGRGSRRIKPLINCSHVWVVEIFRELLARCRILVSVWDNGASVEGQVIWQRWYFCRATEICGVQQTHPRRNVCVIQGGNTEVKLLLFFSLLLTVKTPLNTVNLLCCAENQAVLWLWSQYLRFWLFSLNKPQAITFYVLLWCPTLILNKFRNTTCLMSDFNYWKLFL